MERTRNIRNRSHAACIGIAAAWILGAPGNAGAGAVPFSPRPDLPEAGHGEIGLIANQFPIDPPDGPGTDRHPWLIRFEASPFERLAIEGLGGDGGAGFGLSMALYRQEDMGFDMSVGFDDLFLSSSADLFGMPSEGTPSRVWIGVARTWKWARLRSSAAVESEGDQVEYVPFASAEALLPFHTSLGWETSYSHDVWRNHAGLNLGWDPFTIGFGLSEIQSWLVRDGEFGWWNTPRVGSATGFDNPGWWFSVSFEIPSFERPAPVAPMMPAKSGPVRLDTADLARLELLFVERQVRADLAELAMRSRSEGVDPVETGALRRRILSGGASARKALWNVATDRQADPFERVQAVATAGSSPQESDLEALASLTEEPSARLRAEAALALGRLNSSRARSLLDRLALDPDSAVRDAVKTAR